MINLKVLVIILCLILFTVIAGCKNVKLVTIFIPPEPTITPKPTVSPKPTPEKLDDILFSINKLISESGNRDVLLNEIKLEIEKTREWSKKDGFLKKIRDALITSILTEVIMNGVEGLIESGPNKATNILGMLQEIPNDFYLWNMDTKLKQIISSIEELEIHSHENGDKVNADKVNADKVIAKMEEWGLDIKSATDETTKQKQINEFKAEPIKNRDTVLILFIETVKPQEKYWGQTWKPEYIT